MLKSILVGYDASQPAERAVRFAVELAKPCRATINVVAFPWPSGPPSALEMAGFLESEMERLDRGLVEVCESAKAEGVSLNTTTLPRRLAKRITREATEQNADLIVMGGVDGGRIERWFLRSISEHVSNDAPCPVTIVG